MWRTLLIATLVAWATHMSAQSVVSEFLPELDVEHQLRTDTRFLFQVKQTREDSGGEQTEIGPSISYLRQDWFKLSGKSTSVDFAVGYRYVPSPDEPPINRLEPVITLIVPTYDHLIVSDMNRFDLDWQNGGFPWRYRNRIDLTFPAEMHGYHFAPYVAAEPFYDSQYSKWSDVALYAGFHFPVNKRVEFDVYYEHQNFTGGSANQVFNQVGLALRLAL